MENGTSDAWSMSHSSQRPSVLYWRLSDFKRAQYYTSMWGNEQSSQSWPVADSWLVVVQWENLFLIALNHSTTPPSPLKISCPPPTKQIKTHQSSCLFMASIKTSGSDLLISRPSFSFKYLNNFFSVQHLRASSKIITFSSSPRELFSILANLFSFGINYYQIQYIAYDIIFSLLLRTGRLFWCQRKLWRTCRLWDYERPRFSGGNQRQPKGTLGLPY